MFPQDVVGKLYRDKPNNSFPRWKRKEGFQTTVDVKGGDE
jgi:hypothetical protein